MVITLSFTNSESYQEAWYHFYGKGIKVLPFPFYWQLRITLPVI